MLMYSSLSSQSKTLGRQWNPFMLPAFLIEPVFLGGYSLRDRRPRFLALPIFVRTLKWPLCLWALCCQSQGWPWDFRGCEFAMQYLDLGSDFSALFLWPCSQVEVHITVSSRVFNERAPSPWPQFCIWVAREAKWSWPSSWIWGALDSLEKKGCHSWSFSPIVTTMCCRVALAWPGAGLEGRSTFPSTWPLLNSTSPSAVGLSWLKSCELFKGIFSEQRMQNISYFLYYSVDIALS